jgi:GH24 family phage-related lysozyme (muramidase)
MTHRFVNVRGLELIKHFEGFSAKPYVCPGGYLTIGYGHKIKANEIFTSISKNIGENILSKDLAWAEQAVINYIRVSLNDNQFASLVSFTFNLGAAALQRSTLRQKLNYGYYYDSACEFLNWIYVRGKKNLGLNRRRLAEMNLFLS